MSVKNIVGRAVGKFALKATKHAPTILTGVGITAGVASTVLAAKATLDLTQANMDFAADRADVRARAQEDAEYDDKHFKKDLTLVYGKHTLRLVKLYGPAVTVGVGGITCVVAAHGMMAKRQASLIAAYAVVERSFAQYRTRVEADVTPEKALEYLHGAHTVETGKDNDGNTVTSTTFTDPNGISLYARFFDKENENWERKPEYNLVFLKHTQQYMNDRLHAQGYLFLNDVYEALGMEKSGAGQAVGWLMAAGEKRDCYVDFGLFRGDREAIRRFINGDEASVLLDFNVDGVIWDKI